MGGSPFAISLMGPTASGKTALSLALCEHFPCEIISVDSALVYCGMDIGSAKPDAATRARVPHHLIDIRDPADSYSAAAFRADALAAMRAILAAGRIPLLTGGTMLYFRVLRDGLAAMPPADPAVRAHIEELAGREGWAAVHARLAAVDPQAAARIHPGDPQRLQRALEVHLLTGRSLSSFHSGQARAGDLPCRLVELALAPFERAELHRRIAARFHAMLAEGLVEEVRALHARGDLDPALPALRAVGYRQVLEYLDGVISYDAMVDRAIIATRQLAKRQFTWLRSWTDVHWLLTDASGDFLHEPDGIRRTSVLDATLKIVAAATI